MLKIAISRKELSLRRKLDKDMIEEKAFKAALSGLIAIDSVRTAPQGEYPFGMGANRALVYVLDLAKQMGMRTVNRDGIVGYVEIGQGEEILGILAHLDVVPVGRLEDWQSDPFTLTERDGMYIGRGVIDDKGPALAALFAMKAVLDSGITLRRRVRLILGQGEEAGEWTDMQYYCENEEKITLGFTPDSSFPVIYGEKGILHFDIIIPETTGISVNGGTVPNVVPDRATATLADGSTISAAGKAAHGSMPENGINAIAVVMAQLGDACNMSAFFNKYIGTNVRGELMGCDFSDELTRLSMNAGVIRRDGDRHILSVDVRCPITRDMNDVVAVITEKVDEFGGKIDVRFMSKSVYKPIESELVQTLTKVYRDVTHDSTEPFVIGGGTYSRAMDNIIAFGPCFPWTEETEHQPNERIKKSDLFLAADIYEKAIRLLAGE